MDDTVDPISERVRLVPVNLDLDLQVAVIQHLAILRMQDLQPWSMQCPGEEVRRIQMVGRG